MKDKEKARQQLSDFVHKIHNAKNSTLIPALEAENLFFQGEPHAPQLKPHEKEPNPYNSTLYDQDKDPLFLTYNANRIGESNYIAAEGPKLKGKDLENDEALVRFFDAIFNSQPPIERIVRLGNGNSRRSHYFSRPDFHDYAICNDHYGVYNVKSEHMRGLIIQESEYTLALEDYGPKVPHAFHSQFKLTVQKTDDATTKTIIVDHIDLKDGKAFYCTPREKIVRYQEDYPTNWLYDIYQYANDKQIMVHCASGRGRTCFLILIFVLLDHFSKVFIPNAEKSAKNIVTCLEYVRKYRRNAVHTLEQFIAAIDIALALKFHQIKNCPHLEDKAYEDRPPYINFKKSLEERKNSLIQKIERLQLHKNFPPKRYDNARISLEELKLTLKQQIHYVMKEAHNPLKKKNIKAEFKNIESTVNDVRFYLNQIDMRSDACDDNYLHTCSAELLKKLLRLSTHQKVQIAGISLVATILGAGAGAVIGFFGGAALGSFLGSIIPGAGTVIGFASGGTAGSIVGAKIGLAVTASFLGIASGVSSLHLIRHGIFKLADPYRQINSLTNAVKKIEDQENFIKSLPPWSMRRPTYQWGEYPIQNPIPNPD